MYEPPNRIIAQLVAAIRRNPSATDAILGAELSIPAHVIRTMRQTDMFKAILGMVQK